MALVARSVHSRLGPDRGVAPSSALAGAIFMCNRTTMKECLDLLLFGLPRSRRALVEQILPGMKLFLFEFERRELWGVFEATSCGAMDIIPNAYTGGSFSWQVRVRPIHEYFCLKEEEFREAIRDNYYEKHKFHIHLNESQVSHLSRLFLEKCTTEIYSEVAFMQGDGHCIPNRNSLGFLEGLVDAQLSSHTSDGMNVQIRRYESLKPNDRSVWSRISECPKATLPLSYGKEKENVLLDLASVIDLNATVTMPSSSQTTPKKPLTKPNLAIANDSEDGCRSELLMEDCSFAEEFPVQFKRRRSNSGHDKECIDHPAKKLRRKLSRPSFDVSDVPVELIQPETDNASSNPVITDANAKMGEADETLAIPALSNCKDSDLSPPLAIEDRSLQSSSAQGSVGSPILVATPNVQESNENEGNYSLVVKHSSRNDVAENYQPSDNHGIRDGNALAGEDCPVRASKGTFGYNQVEMKHSDTSGRVIGPEVSTLNSELAGDAVNLSSEMPTDSVISRITVSEKRPSTLSEASSIDDESVCTQLALGMPIHSCSYNGNVKIKRQQSQSYGHLLSLGQPICMQAPETEGSNAEQGIPVLLVNNDGTDLADAPFRSCGSISVESLCNQLQMSSNLSNEIDLKLFLQSGVQVSGVKLHLGSSPCLILELEDSLVVSSVDNTPKSS